MAAIVVGSVVAVGVALGAVDVKQEAPKLGVVESVGGAGPPPTAVVVDWEDGTRATYAVTLGVIVQVLPISTPSLLGSTVTIAPGTGLPNAGGRATGPVIMHAILDSASGGTPQEFVVIQTKLGFLTMPVSVIQVLPNA